MDNIKVDQTPNTKVNKKKKSKLSTDMTDAGPSENSIERSNANIIKTKKSFWKNIFRFKSRKQEMPESVVTDMRRNAMKVPNLATIFEEDEDSEILDTGSKNTEKTDTSWIPLPEPDQASSKFESTTDEYLVDDSLSSEEEIPKEKIMLPEGNADKILKEIQAQIKKGKVKKLKDDGKTESDQASTITKEDYSFEYSGSSGQSLDEEEKANKIINQNKELVESLVNQYDIESNKPGSADLSEHASKEVVAKLSEKKVTFLPAPYEDLPDFSTGATFEPTEVLSEDIESNTEGSLGAEEQMDTGTPERPVATMVAFQQDAGSTEATSNSDLNQSSLSPSAPSEDLDSSIDQEETPEPSMQQLQPSATDAARTAPPTNLNNNNINTHAISSSTSTSNDDDDEQDWRHLYDDVEDEEHQLYQRLAEVKSVESSDSINEVEVWCQDLNEMAPKQFDAFTQITEQQILPTHPEELQAPKRALDIQKTVLPLEEFGAKFSSNETSDKTYTTFNEDTAIFSKAFMYNVHAETNFQAPTALDFNFPMKDGQDELNISTRTMEEKGDLRLDKFFKMIFDHASQNYVVVYDPLPTELPDSALAPQREERCKVTRKRKIMSLLHDKRMYDEYLKEFEELEPNSVESANKESKINLLLLEGSGTQVTSFGRSYGNSSTSDLRHYRRKHSNSSDTDKAGPSQGHRPTKSLDDLIKNSKNYYVPSNSPVALSSKTSNLSKAFTGEASSSSFSAALSFEEPGISVVLEHTRKKLMNFISNHSERSSEEQLNSLYPNNYLGRFNISSDNHMDEDDQIDQISLDSIMSGFDHYDQLTSVTSLDAYHTEKVETFETVEHDVRTLINELLVQVDELKEDCIKAGVNRSSDGSLMVDVTTQLAGTEAQSVLDDIIECTLQVCNDKTTINECDLSGDQLKASDSQSKVVDGDVKTCTMENKNEDDFESMDESENSPLVEDSKVVPSAEPHMDPNSSFSFIKHFGHLKDQPTTITIETNSEKQVFLKNHCSLKEGLQKTAGFLTSIYSELCEYNPVSYLMHQSITPKLEPEPPEVHEPEPTVEANLEQTDVESSAAGSEYLKNGPPEVELLEEAAGFSDYYENKTMEAQDLEQCEQVISIQNNEHFVVNQVNLEEPQPQSSSWASKCTKVAKDFKYLPQDKDTIRAAEKFRFVVPKDDTEIDQKLLYTFDGNSPRSDLNLSFLEHEIDPDPDYKPKAYEKLQDQNFDMINSSEEMRLKPKTRRRSISEDRSRADSDSEQDLSQPTDLNVSKEHAHVKFAIPAINDPAISLDTDIEDLEFPSDPDQMSGFRYMYPSINAGLSISSSSIDPELTYPSLITSDEDLNEHVQSVHTAHYAPPLSRDPGSGEMSDSSSFFTHTLNTAESFVKRLENAVFPENLVPQGEVGAETQMPGPSSVTILMQKPFSAGSGQSENTKNQLVMMALHQDMLNVSDNSSADHESIDDIGTPHRQGHLQLERKTPELDLPTVEKEMAHKIEEDLRSVQESINQIVDVNKKTISIVNSPQVSTPNDSISTVSSGGFIEINTVEDPGPEKGNCHQTSVHKLDAPLLDSFQPRLNPINTSSSASSGPHSSFAQHNLEDQISLQDEQDIDGDSRLLQLPDDDFMTQAQLIREQITARLIKQKQEAEEIRQKKMNDCQGDENREDTYSMAEAIFKKLLRSEEIQVNMKTSEARKDLSESCVLELEELDVDKGEIKRTVEKTNLIEEMLNAAEQRSRATELDEAEFRARLQSDTMTYQEKNSCFYVGTQIDEICNEMGRLCLSADSEKVPMKTFNFGLRKSQIFKDELDKKVKVSFGECGSSSSADNATTSNYCAHEEPIDKAIEE